MNTSYVRQNFAGMQTGFTDLSLADFLRRRVIPDSESYTGKPLSLEHFIKQLQSGTLVGEHEWNNLSAILSMSAALFGQNYSMAMAYCMQRARNFLAATFIPPSQITETYRTYA